MEERGGKCRESGTQKEREVTRAVWEGVTSKAVR